MAAYPHPSTPGRSANMRANRRTDTKPELVLRRALHKLGYRYRKDYRLVLEGGRPVRPDIAFTARRVAVFVDGCFWHACPEHGSKPAVNDWYWTPKLARNVERDRTADATLAAAGWQVVRVWEHETLEQAMAAVVAAVGARPPAGASTQARPRPSPPASDRLRASRSADKISLPAQNPRGHARLPGVHDVGAGGGAAGRTDRPGATGRLRGHAGPA